MTKIIASFIELFYECGDRYGTNFFDVHSNDIFGIFEENTSQIFIDFEGEKTKAVT